MTTKRLTLDETLEALLLGYACAAEAEMPKALENGVEAIKESFKEYGYRLVQPLSPISGTLVELEKSQKVPMYSEKYRLTPAGKVRKNFDYSDYSMRYRFEKQVREYLRKQGFRRVKVAQLAADRKGAAE